MKSLQVPQTLAMNVNDLSYAQPLPHIVAAIPPAGSIVNMNNKIASDSKPLTSVVSVSNSGLPFIAMPESSAQLTDRISHSPAIIQDSDNQLSKDNFIQVNYLVIYN